MDIYEEAIRKADQADTFLAVCAGNYDGETFRRAGIANVTISNLSPDNVECQGFPTTRADAEALPFDDQSFDWVTVHAGLHHCASPHRGLLEMCRVARKGVIVVESRDSALMRLGVALGLVPEYEIDAVAISGYRNGGMRDSATPNFVYRWTEREIEKTVASAFPDRRPEVRYLYSIRIPYLRYEMYSLPKRTLRIAMGFAAKAFAKLLPSQCNQFAFIVRLDGKRHAWIAGDGTMRRDAPLGFDPAKYWRNR